MEDVLLKAGALLFMVFFFGLCIFVHELGHFLVARWRGLHVIAFSIGFKKIWWRKIGGIEYRIGCIPFGGYVEIPQIDATGEAKDENGKALPKAKPIDRMLAVFAGPLFNIAFGLFLGVFVWVFGIPQDTPKLKTITVATIEENSPEYLAGLRKGDVIHKINGDTFYDTWAGIVRKILFDLGDKRLAVVRDGKEMTISYRPKINSNIMPEEEIAYPFFRPRLPVILYPEKDSPAEKAGIKAGDEVIRLGSKEIFGHDQFSDMILYANGRPITLTVLRDGKEIDIPDLKGKPIPSNAGTFMLGVSYTSAGRSVLLNEICSSSPAEAAGLRAGDEILAIDGVHFKDPFDFGKAIASSDGRPLKFSILRNGAEMNIEASPKLINHYDIGVMFAYINHPNPVKQFTDVIQLSYKSVRGVMVTLFNRMGLTQQYSTLKPSNFSGFIGIGKYIYKSVYYGSFMQGIYLVIIISFNLGLLNLLPIPVLDGGHIVLALFEMVFKRPPSAKLLQPVTIAFVALLIAFMLFVTYHDVRKMLPIYGRPAPAGNAKIIQESAANIEDAKGRPSDNGAAKTDKKD